MPARGIIEAKCTAPDVGLTADGGGGLQVWQAFVAADGDEIGLPAGVVWGWKAGRAAVNGHNDIKDTI